MPTYDLACEDCGERFERFLMRFLRDEDKVCPQCGSVRVSTGVGGGFLGSRTTSHSVPPSACGGGGFR